MALSTAEAEYVALSSAAQEAVWLRRLLLELKFEQTDPIVMFEDNQAAISLSYNPQFHGRSKHIDIRHHFIREKVNDKTIVLKYCPSECMLADMLTKGLPSNVFESSNILLQ